MSVYQQQLTLLIAVYATSALGKGMNMYFSLDLIFPPTQIYNFALRVVTLSIFLLPLPREADAKKQQPRPQAQEGGKKRKKLSCAEVQQNTIGATDSVLSTNSTSVL